MYYIIVYIIYSVYFGIFPLQQTRAETLVPN